MKSSLHLILASLIIFFSCNNCHCEGGAPVISPQNNALLIFKRDTMLDFINQTNIDETINVGVSRFHYDNLDRGRNCMPLLRKKICVCPSDDSQSDGYEQTCNDNSFRFSLKITTDNTCSTVHYNLNQIGFTEFDSSNLSKTINNTLITGIHAKYFPSVYDSVSYIYYKESLGIISVGYKNGKKIDLK